jgi:hypothetical protein
MTHDELMVVVNDYDIGLSNGMVRKENVFAVAKAFRAVVELHQPKLWQGIEMVCRGCGTDIEQNYNSAYPCPTIQAIEKELA